MNELQKEHIRKYGVNGEEVIRVVEAQEAELKKACRIMADLLTCYNLELEDGSFTCAVTEEGEEVARFLEKNGFAVFDQDEYTVRIHWEKLSEEKP